LSRKEMEREFKRKLIAQAARELFLARSYEEVTVQDIASAAEFGKGTIYQYFSSKEEILYYLIAQSMQEANEKMIRDFLNQPDAFQALNTFISLQYEQYMAGNRLFLSYLRLMLEGNLKQEWLTATGYLREQKLQYIADIISRGQAEGIFIEADSLQLARSLRNVIRGFTMEQLESHLKENKDTNDMELIKQVIFSGIVRSR